ncbi:MAG TPA: lipoprotein [Pseudomonadales bacterium]|nr:lipoprotein [Pseudomonadales bacterium]
MRILLLGMLALMVAGCGQKGALYLPDKPAKSDQHTVHSGQ